MKTNVVLGLLLATTIYGLLTEPEGFSRLLFGAVFLVVIYACWLHREDRRF